MAKDKKGKKAKKAGAAAATTGSSGADAAFDWRASLACVATYRVLEGNDKLDQFEEAELPFEDAADRLLSTLRYFPGATANRDILDLLGFEMARRFLKLLVLNFTVTREKDVSSAEILRALAPVFASKTATIKDLAETVDRTIHFSDEEPA
jgi:hypothetical protein